jgi:hypothetical protein
MVLLVKMLDRAVKAPSVATLKIAIRWLLSFSSSAGSTVSCKQPVIIKSIYSQEIAIARIYKNFKDSSVLILY